MDPTDQERLALDELVRRVDDAALLAISLHQVISGLGALDPENPHERALAAALFYYGQRGTHGREFFGPARESDEGQFPPPLDSVPDEMATTWEALSSRVTSPLLQARLHDLCFTARIGRGIDHAKAAVDGYVALARRYSEGWEREDQRLHLSVDATRYVARALDLARQVSDDSLAQMVMDASLDLTRFAFSDPDAGPGVTLGLLDPLVADRACPLEVDELLVFARERYKDDVWNTMSTIALQVTRAPGPEARRAFIGEQVEALLGAADTSEPINAILHLRQAEEISSRYGLTALNATVRLRLQELRGADLGMTRTTHEVELDRKPIDRWVDQLRGEETWHAALLGLLSTIAPTGRVESNRALAEEMPTIAPLQSMMPTLQFGPDGSIDGSTGGDDPDHLLEKIELQQIQMLGPILGFGLRGILEYFGPISEADAAAAFQVRPHVSPQVAECLARAITRHASGDYEGAAYTALPRIERLMRDCLVLLREPVTRPGFGGSARGHRGIGDMVTTLEESGLDPSWSRFFQSFLAGRLNVRNDALHGNLGPVNETLSALVLIAGFYLALLELAVDGGA